MSTTEQNQANPFGAAEAWETSTGEWLGEGNHIVTIDSAEDASSQQGKPQIALEFSNENGKKSDWLNYNAEFLSKVVALFDAAGIPRPQDGEFNPADNCRLTAACRARLVGKKVGIVIRPEADYKDPSKNVLRVQGYVPTSRIGEVPIATQGLPAAAAPASSGASGGPDIPFLRDEDRFEFEAFRGHSNR